MFFFSSSSNGFSSSDDFTYDSSYERILEDMDQNDLMILQMMLVACKSNDFFTSHEMEEMMGNMWT